MASFKKFEWTVKFDGSNAVINFIRPGCMWTGKTWTVTEEFYKSCGSHPLWTANKLAANDAAETRQKFMDTAIAGGFMLLSGTPGLIAEQQASWRGEMAAQIMTTTPTRMSEMVKSPETTDFFSVTVRPSRDASTLL